ncbi:Olfactory receptor 5AN1 [Microtus ochrogaster]|uniref:Olfactory receptor 5AN1 n=1 Tax=Microtus ochrogaster TaxID=79684 RepID=A0A8J6GK55_MICOH|nr:Olfactory receptor 5AN1 [Microtus ochrogaster]
MLFNFFQEKQMISFMGCIVQYFIFSTTGLSESCLMTAMAYDSSGIFVYLCSSSGGSSSFDRFASVFYTVMIPMLNPLIYSLRNQEIKDAMKRLQKKIICCLGHR